MKPYYEENGISIYLGDSREVLQSMVQQFELIVTDPPYGIAFQSTWPTEERKKEKIQNDGFEEYLSLLSWMLPKFGAHLVPGGIVACCCCGGGGTPSLAHLWIEAGKHLTVENVCIWDKGYVGVGWRYRFQWEAVLIATKGERRVWNGGEAKSNVLRVQKIIPQNGEHPTPKPVGLMRELIECNSNVGDTVFDPFCGSGSTLLAAKECGRKAVGIEIEEKYCEIAAKRLQQEVLPLDFTPPPPKEENLSLGLGD